MFEYKTWKQHLGPDDDPASEVFVSEEAVGLPLQKCVKDHCQGKCSI